MRPIEIERLPQPDGTIHYQATVNCPLGPCSKIYPESIYPESCGCLHSDGVDDEGKIKWCCSKPPCSSGV